MPSLVVLADDRTGALETAAGLAACGVRTEMWPVAAFTGAGASPWLVVDLGSRHLAGRDAAARVVATIDRIGGPPAPAPRWMHKIDSTLRGNWAREVLVHTQRGGRVLLVAAFPAVGRTCVGGVVLDHGRPVADGPAGADPLAPVRWSRPAEHLHAAGHRRVAELAGPGEVAQWLVSDATGVAVCDAHADDDLDRLAALWWATDGGTPAVLAGTAAALTAAASAVSGVHPTTLPAPPTGSAVLVVCGSVHPAAAAQLRALADAGVPVSTVDGTGGFADAQVPPGGPVVLRTPPRPAGAPGDPRSATALAGAARRVLAGRRFDAVVVVGGETAAALLGDAPMVVVGSMGPGIAVAEPPGDPGGPPVITKPGGFGGPEVLLRLVGARMGA